MTVQLDSMLGMNYCNPHHIIATVPPLNFTLCLYYAFFLLLHVSRDVHHCIYLFGGKVTFVYVAGPLLLSNVRTGYFWMFVTTLRCQINESTRLSFLDFPHPTCTYSTKFDLQIFHPSHLLGTFFHPTHLFGPTLLWNLLKISTLLVYFALLI